MNFKVSIVLLHLTVTIPMIQYSYSVSANNHDANETQSKIRKISTIMTTSTIVSETCNDRFCYNSTNEITLNNKSKEFAPSYKEYDRLKSTSILYGVVKIASQRPQTSKCYRELNHIYDSIHRKEIWAIKGKQFPFQEKKKENNLGKVYHVDCPNWKVHLNKDTFLLEKKCFHLELIKIFIAKYHLFQHWIRLECRHLDLCSVTIFGWDQYKNAKLYKNRRLLQYRIDSNDLCMPIYGQQQLHLISIIEWFTPNIVHHGKFKWNLF